MLKEFLYGSPLRRTIMRFIEIFVLGGLSTLVFAPEFEQWLEVVLGTAAAATILKFLRELIS